MPVWLSVWTDGRTDFLEGICLGTFLNHETGILVVPAFKEDFHIILVLIMIMLDMLYGRWAHIKVKLRFPPPPDMVMAVDAHGHVIPHKERMAGTPFRILQGYCQKKMSLCEDQPPETNQHS